MTAQIDLSQLPPEVREAIQQGRAKVAVSKQRVWCDCNLGLTGQALQDHFNAGCPNKRVGEAEGAEVTLV